MRDFGSLAVRQPKAAELLESLDGFLVYQLVAMATGSASRRRDSA